jgi:hypothetical protein
MLSAYARDLLLAWMFTSGSATRPTTWFVSLHEADPGTTGADEVVVGTDADYVRQAVTFDTPSGGQADNTGALTWTADVAATTYSVTHIGVWDAATGGNFLVGGALAVPEEVVASASLVIGIGRAVAALS